MNTSRKLCILLALMFITAVASADTEFPASGKTGNLDILDAANWTNGVPTNENPGVINLSSTVSGWYDGFADMSGKTVVIQLADPGDTDGVLKYTRPNGVTVGQYETQAGQGGAATITVNSGTWEPYGERDGIRAKGCTITINGGLVDCNNKQINYSSGSNEVIINGGMFKATQIRSNNPSRGSFKINGGEVQLSSSGNAIPANGARIDFDIISHGRLTVLGGNYTGGLLTRLANNVFSIEGVTINNFDDFEVFEYDSVSGNTYLQLFKDNQRLARNVYPADEEIDVPVEVTLQWKPGYDPNEAGWPDASTPIVNQNITQYYVYFKVGDDDFSGVTPVVVDADEDNNGFVDDMSSQDFNSLQFNEDVYWRVDQSINDSAADDPNTMTGPTWMFTSTNPTPTISKQPVSQVRGPANEKLDALMTVVASAPIGTLSYQWEKDGSPLSDGPTGNGSVISGATDPCLMITDVAMADAGEYVCEVTTTVNSSSVSADSDAAVLEYAQLTDQWAFENNLDDSVDGQNGLNSGTHTGSGASYVAGLVGGQSLDLSSDPCLVSLPTAVIPGNTAEISLSFWVKHTAETWYGSDAIFVAKDAEDNSAVEMWAPYFVQFIFDAPASNRVRNQLLPNEEQTYLDELKDQWVHVVATKDAETGLMKLYFNGEWANTATDQTLRLSDAVSVFLGNIVGQIDDFRVYNYALDSVEVAKLYHEVTGESVCSGLEDPIISSFDVNGDCEISLEDFALIVSENWLYCKIVPDCIN